MTGFVSGRPEEWADFENRRTTFLERFSVLKEAVNRAYVRTFQSAEPVDMVVFYTGRLCAEEFLEIVLLCTNGYGFGAMKLLRGMYERVVTARYLHLNPEHTEAYLDFDVVSRGKYAHAVRETFADQLSRDQIEQFAAVEQEATTLRDRFKIPLCEKCGTTRVNHTWSRLDVVSMARAAGGKLAEWVVPCYYEPLNHAHSTMRALVLRLEGSDEDGWSFDTRPQRDVADRVLMLGHFLVLHSLDLQREHFKLDELERAVENASVAYKEIWGLTAR